MIRGIAWVLFFTSWFWVDARWSDPAILKDMLLPLTLSLLLLATATRWRPGIASWLFFAFVAWSLAWMRGCAPADQTVLAIGTGGLAFLVGAAGGRPPPVLAIAAFALAVAKGWDDLLFLRNIGGGIPFTPTSFFVHRNLFALLLAPSLFLLAGWLTTRPRGKAWTWVGWSVVVAGAVLLFASESRGATMGFVAGASMLLIWWAWKASSGRGRVLALVALTLALGIGGISQAGRFEQTRLEVASILRMESITTKVPDRFRSWVWMGGLRLWQESPIVGIGVGEFRYGIESALDPWTDLYRPRRIRVDVAHSHWLQTMVERGVVGLLLEASLWGLAVVMAFRSGAKFLAAALLCMGVHGLVGEGLEYAQGAILWWFLIGAAIGAGRSEGPPVRWWGAALLLALLYPLGTFARTVLVEHRIEQARNSHVPLGAEDLAQAWEDAPRSPEVLLEIATIQARGGAVLDARRTLEYRRHLCSRSCALGGEVLLAGVWRVTGAMDSAQALLESSLRLYPTDPWLVHDYLRQRRATRGCVAVLESIDSMRGRMDSILLPHRPSPPATWTTWRHRLALDRTLAESANSRGAMANAEALRLAGKEWIQARAMCADSL